MRIFSQKSGVKRYNLHKRKHANAIRINKLEAMGENRKRNAKEDNVPILDIGDIGDFDFDFNPALFDISGNLNEETRYVKPKVQPVQKGYVLYDNARKLAKELRINKGERFDALVGGNFIFGDFIEAYIVEHNAKCRKMTVSTLSLGQENVDSFRTLLEKGYVDELSLLVSVYFYSHEAHSLIPYIYERLDNGHTWNFQLSVAAIHTKTAQFLTLGGRKVVIHGSANLRSSGNIEQFTIEENAELYDFYDERLSRIAEKYATIKKAVRGDDLWNAIERKRFD